MSDYRELVAILKEILTNRFYPMPQFTHGLLGDGNGNVEVAGRPDYNYVRFSRTTDTVFQVFNKEVSQPVDNWPVLIGELPWQPGLVQVVATDWNVYIQTKWGNNVASIQTHAPTHEWPTFAPGSDAVNVYPRALTPLRTQSGGSGSNAVFVSPYEYDWTGTNAQWPGVPAMDFSAKPPTGSMLYMGVYLNPTTNALGVVSGSTTVFTDALEPALPNWPLGVYPSGYVRLYGGQAYITERDIRPAQRLYGSTLIFTGTSSGGGWPFAQVLTVSLTDINADYATLAAAAAVANNQTILLDSETYTITDQSLANTITLTGVLGQTVISGSIVDGATLTIANMSTFLRFLRVSHTGGGTLSGAILTDQDATFLERLIVRKTTGAPATGYGVHITGGASSGSYLLNCDISVTSGTSRYGVLIDTAASITVIDGGEYNSTTADILVNHASANVTLKGPRLRGGGLTVTAGTVKGWYINSNGDVITVNGSGVSGGVWLDDVSTGLVTHYSSSSLGAALTAAIAAANTGDTIRLGVGVYTLAASQTVGVAISIAGEGGPQNVVIESADANIFALTAAGITLRGITGNNTHASGTDGACVQWNVNDITIDDCIFNKTGAADDGACLLQYGGTGARIINTVANSSGATRNYAYWNNTAVAACEVIGGSFSGTTQDILSDQASTITLRGVRLVNGTMSTTAVQGSCIDDKGRDCGFVALNSSGATVSRGDVGYLTNTGAFLTSTTSGNFIGTEVAVTVGGINAGLVFVKKTGRMTLNYSGSAPASGDYLIQGTTAGKVITNGAAMNPGLLAVAVAAGAANLVEVELFLNRTPVTIFNSNNILRVSGSSDSAFNSTISGTPGATLTYNAPTGNEDSIVPAATGELAKLILWNTTKTPDEFALIQAVNTGTNVITPTAAITGWSNTEAIQVNSTTVTGASTTFFDLQLADTAVIPALATALVFEMTISESGTGELFIHPYETYGASKAQSVRSTVGYGTARKYGKVTLINRRFAYSLDASGAGAATTILRLLGYEIATA